MQPPRNLLLATLALVAGFAALAAFAQSPSDTCAQGFVWREAFPRDHVCVVPETRAQAARDNSEAAARVQPGGGDYGPNTCLSGFVWRTAKADDLVCVTPDVRAQTAADNAASASRRASAYSGNPAAGSVIGAIVGSAAVTSAAVRPPVAVNAYRTSEWSPWTRTDGAQFRYRWGWNPQDRKYASQIDAMFEIRNTQGGVWHGAARSVDCTRGTLSGSKSIDVAPNGTGVTQFSTANCGSLNNPSFIPSVVQSKNL